MSNTVTVADANTDPFPVPSGATILKRCAGWDWLIPFTLQDSGGNPLDLPGDLSAWLSIGPNVAKAALPLTDLGAGNYLTWVTAGVTVGVPAQPDTADNFPTRVIIVVDSNGLNYPIRIFPVHVLDPSQTFLLS